LHGGNIKAERPNRERKGKRRIHCQRLEPPKVLVERENHNKTIPVRKVNAAGFPYLGRWILGYSFGKGPEASRTVQIRIPPKAKSLWGSNSPKKGKKGVEKSINT